jgi:hypothetical protein
MTSLPAEHEDIYAKFSQRSGIRLFACAPGIDDLYRIFAAHAASAESIWVERESQDPLLMELNLAASDGLQNKFEKFVFQVRGKRLNRVKFEDSRSNFSYFDWDDRYFIVGGTSHFVSVCHPMPLWAGKLHFEDQAADSLDEQMLLNLWERLEPLM